MVSLALIICAHSAAAQKTDPLAQAKALLKRGFVLAKQGRANKDPNKLRAAIALFKRSFELDASPLGQCNIGLAYFDLKRLPQAHLFLGDCLNRLGATKPKFVSTMRNFHGQVEQALRAAGFYPLDVRTEPSGASVSVNSFAADETFRAPRLIWLDRRDHQFTARLPGYVTATTPLAMSAARSRFPLVIHLKRALRPEPAIEPGSKDPARQVEPPAKPIAIDYDTRPAPRGALPLVTLSAGIFALAGGGVMHAIALDKRAELEAMEAGPARDAAVSTFEKQRFAVIGLYAAGAVSTGLGIYLYSRKRKLIRVERKTMVLVGPASDGSAGATLWVRGSY